MYINQVYFHFSSHLLREHLPHCIESDPRKVLKICRYSRLPMLIEMHRILILVQIFRVRVRFVCVFLFEYIFNRSFFFLSTHSHTHTYAHTHRCIKDVANTSLWKQRHFHESTQRKTRCANFSDRIKRNDDFRTANSCRKLILVFIQHARRNVCHAPIGSKDLERYKIKMVQHTTLPCGAGTCFNDWSFRSSFDKKSYPGNV